MSAAGGVGGGGEEEERRGRGRKRKKKEGERETEKERESYRREGRRRCGPAPHGRAWRTTMAPATRRRFYSERRGLRNVIAPPRALGGARDLRAVLRMGRQRAACHALSPTDLGADPQSAGIGPGEPRDCQSGRALGSVRGSPGIGPGELNLSSLNFFSFYQSLIHVVQQAVVVPQICPPVTVGRAWMISQIHGVFSGCSYSN